MIQEKGWRPGDWPETGVWYETDARADWTLPPLARDPDDLNLPAWAERTLLAVILAFVVALVVYGIWLGPAVAG